MMKAINKYYLDNNIIEMIRNINTSNFENTINEIYKKCQEISIDYAVLEKAQNIYVIKSNLSWDDVGTWKALSKYMESDDWGNLIKGNVQIYNSKNNMIYANNKEILLFNVNEIFCIDAEECIIIGKKSKLDDIPKLYKEQIMKHTKNLL